ncbi:type III-B CRISPR module-associated protein Cmr5 [Paenibacillus sp. L3-i20]|uniref:type III-B CRISPR module-associated protein Cmr5 n=1 Tax=Paenibacillus sp. L3-i20 TaxID=2905833 RepID=UPI001EE0AFB9|nr:type III-B CRISPR module-associated protein Cmr5 [Paenibacillus sp. L3-i20]GKU76474.1 hypothetical protein L3i20_v208710 [Paenibacillus sp. L3-i20]
MKSFEQQYAMNVLACIYETEKEKGGIKGEYGRVCHKFPYMVLTNGLRLTVAFFQAKGGVHTQYLNDMSKVLGSDDWTDLLSKNQMEYRMMTLQSLKAAAWFKRYAQTILKVDADGSTGESESTNLQIPLDIQGERESG